MAIPGFTNLCDRSDSPNNLPLVPELHLTPGIHLAILLTPIGDVATRPAAGYIRLIGMMCWRFPDLQRMLEGMVAEGDKVTARFILWSTHRAASSASRDRKDNRGAGE